MTRASPTIADSYFAKLAAFRQHTPFGVLLDEDRLALLRSVARDVGVTTEEAFAGILMRNVGVQHG